MIKADKLIQMFIEHEDTLDTPELPRWRDQFLFACYEKAARKEGWVQIGERGYSLEEVAKTERATINHIEKFVFYNPQKAKDSLNHSEDWLDLCADYGIDPPVHCDGHYVIEGKELIEELRGRGEIVLPLLDFDIWCRQLDRNTGE